MLLVDQSERFVFKPLLYELLSGGMLVSGLNYAGSPYCCLRLPKWSYESAEQAEPEFFYAEVDAWEVAPRFLDLLANTGVQFLQDRVKVLHPADHFGTVESRGYGCGGTVLLESGFLIEYDWYNVNSLHPFLIVTV